MIKVQIPLDVFNVWIINDTLMFAFPYCCVVLLFEVMILSHCNVELNGLISCATNGPIEIPSWPKMASPKSFLSSFIYSQPRKCKEYFPWWYSLKVLHCLRNGSCRWNRYEKMHMIRHYLQCSNGEIVLVCQGFKHKFTKFHQLSVGENSMPILRTENDVKVCFTNGMLIMFDFHVDFP